MITFGHKYDLGIISKQPPNRAQLFLKNQDDEVLRPCTLDTSQPVKIQVFVDETLIEFFVNDQFAQSCILDKWWPMEGTLKISLDRAEVLKSEVRVHR
jgi:sucrose-6-phosphate hydrolase SacC (GH32 family)